MNKKVVITQEDNKVIAVLKENGREIKRGFVNYTGDFNANAIQAFKNCIRNINNKFKIGDKVIITDTGQHYPTYSEFVETFAPDLLDNFIYGQEHIEQIDCTKRYEIINYAYHEDSLIFSNPLYIIKDDKSNVFVFDECGLSKKTELKLFDGNIKTCFGIVGEPTQQTAFFGEKLFVGDIVEVYNVTTKHNFGKHIICKTEQYPQGFVFDVIDINFVNGIGDEWQIRKVRGCEEFKSSEDISRLACGNFKIIED